MWLSGSRAILTLFPLFLGWISIVAASPVDSSGKKCTNPQVRREWRALSDEEKAEYISAVKCLAKVPHKEYVVPYPNHVNFTVDVPLIKNSSMFDDFTFIHMDLNPLIHFTGHFLPWHRSFVHRYERALQEECGFKGTQPYWDWTKDSGDFYNSPLFDPKTGFGGWGDPSDDWQITTGPFASDFSLAYPSPHRLRRNYTAASPGGGFPDGTPSKSGPLNTSFTPEIIESMVNGHRGDFAGFQAFFEGIEGSHGAIHQSIGGDLFGFCPLSAGPDCRRGPKWTPNEPLFYFHHAMVDKLWDDWQRLHPENFWSYHGGSVGGHSAPGIYNQFPNGGPPFLDLGDDVPGDGLLDKATTYELMDIKAYDFCYTYE